jgi:ATP-dependent Clp protease ATP-binding subunit ClpA
VLFVDDVFSPHTLADQRTADVLVAAADRAADSLRPSDILYSAVAGSDHRLVAIIRAALADGAQPRDLLDGIDLFNPARAGRRSFDGTRERFTPQALAALDEFGAQAGGLAPDAGLESLVACVLAHLDEEEARYLRILDVDRAREALGEHVRHSGDAVTDLFDATSKRLRSEEFSAQAWAILELAATRAAELGYDRILPPHIFLALLGEVEGLLERLIRLQMSPRMGITKVLQTLLTAFRITEDARTRLMLERDFFGNSLLAVLVRARRSAATFGAERIETIHLLAAVLESPAPRLAAVLTAEPLHIDLARMREQVDRALSETGTAASHEVAFRLPGGLPPHEDLTWLARTAGIAPALHADRYIEPLVKALHRTTGNHVLITGLPGVGTTTLVRELARRAAVGEIPFLRRKRFLWIDCRDVAPADAGTVLAGIIGHVASRTDIVVCLDDLGSLLRGERDHRPALRSALKEGRLHLIGVLSDTDYDDMLAADRGLSELTSRVDLVEPDRVAATEMAARAAAGIAGQFGLTVTDRGIDRAVALSIDYILGERLPAKAVKVLRRACEELHYARSQLGDPRTSVDVEDIVQVVAEISGLPADQISGTGGAADIDRTLNGAVVGQSAAVRTVVRELRRIKAGLTSSSRRPTVLLFAGLTGVGKTELAKTIAQIYSTSKRLHTYPMANFTEPHSVSGIIGSPPGYIGHDNGGRLVNDLNADPYCVFLLDEAEKAHPDVWRPFLNLFDEGWLIDQRGVKALADRAMFILTTNAGHDVIARMTAEGRTQEEITVAVEGVLRGLREHRSGALVFPAEFLARIGQIIVFRPLDHTAMAGICRKITYERCRWWREQREKELRVPPALIEHVAARAFAANEAAGGAKGGRIVRAMISNLVDDVIALEAERRPDDFRSCSAIELAFDGANVSARFAPAKAMP